MNDPRGERRPAYQSVSEWADTAGGEADALMRAAGVQMMAWQRDVLDAWLAETDAGWVHSTGALIVPRQNGKTWALVARMLYGLFLVESERLILYSAHQFKTAEETWRIVRDLVERTPGLRSRVAKNGIRNSHGQEGIETVDGSRLRIVARTNSTSSSGRGFSPDCVILDEAMILTDESWSAILPALSARPNPQVLLASSAGTVESEVLTRFRDLGRAGTDARLAYHEWCALVDDDRDDPRSWARANPGLGDTLRADFIRHELGTMRAGDFDRERLGLWSTESRAESALDGDTFTDAVVELLPRPVGVPVTLAVDVHSRLRGQRESAIVAAWSNGQVVQSVIVQSGPGVRWLPDRLLALIGEWNATGVHMSIGSAKDVAADLEAAGVNVIPVPRDEFRASCMGLAQAFTDRRVQVQASPSLAAAAANVPARQFPDGGWVFDSRRSSVSAAPLIGLAVAVRVVQSAAGYDYDVLSSVY